MSKRISLYLDSDSAKILNKKHNASGYVRDLIKKDLDCQVISFVPDIKVNEILSKVDDINDYINSAIIFYNIFYSVGLLFVPYQKKEKKKDED